jgi:hypothetical protein
MDWIWFDSLAGKQGKADALGDGSEQQLALHHGEVIANADAWTCAERQVRITGQLFLPFRCEALGIKLLRLWEVFLATVQGLTLSRINERGVLPSSRRLAYEHCCSQVAVICPEAFPANRMFPCAPGYMLLPGYSGRRCDLDPVRRHSQGRCGCVLTDSS